MRLASVLSVCCVLGACGNTARITLDDGTAVEGKIVGSNVVSIMVEEEGGGALQAVRRSSVTDIDHPGNGALTVGLILAVYGAANIALGAPRCEKEGAAFCVGVFTPAVLGLGLTGYGGSVYAGSVNATGQRRRSAFSLQLLPILQQRSGGSFAGLAAGTLF